MNLGPHGSPLPGQVVVFDTETTGLYPFGEEHDRICSISLQKYRRTQKGRWYQYEVFNVVCNPKRPIKPEITLINGFYWDPDNNFNDPNNLAMHPVFDYYVDKIIHFIKDEYLIAHHVAFDISFLESEIYPLKKKLLNNPLICTKKAFSDIQGKGRSNDYVPGTSLNKLCDTLGVDRNRRKDSCGKELHTAFIDTYLTAQCAFILNNQGWLQIESIDELPHRNFISLKE